MSTFYGEPVPKTRDRGPRVDRKRLYGEWAQLMEPGKAVRDQIRDRAAYLYITGFLPSHLRKRNTKILVQISRDFKKPSSLDARNGSRLVLPEVAADLGMEKHEMVKAVRAKIREGYLIEPFRGYGSRRGYSKIYLFRMGVNQEVISPCFVNITGATKNGWA